MIGRGFFALVALVAGCGSSTGETVPPFRIPERRSYTMTITEVRQAHPPEGPHPASPSKGFTARVDLEVPEHGATFIEGSILPRLQAGSALRGALEGDHVTMKSSSGPLLTL